MDPQLQTLGLQLADVTVRNTAGSITDRIRAVKARRRDQETIAELEDIINGLLSDKSELVRIAQAYEEELVAQRISATDIEYITTNLVPVLRRLIESTPTSGGTGAATPQEIIDLIQPLLSVETVTVLQLVGFNFRKAIGEPLTQLVSQQISKARADPALTLELQRLSLVRENAYLAVAQDPEAHARLMTMLGGGSNPMQNPDS
jgi:hypothetical protein